MIGRIFEGWHLIIILMIVLVLFGRGKVSEFMGDFAKGIKSFKKGLSDEDDKVSPQAGNSGHLSAGQNPPPSSVNMQNAERQSPHNSGNSDSR